MKKSLLALAALSAFAGVASAQSSVTLFGIVDQSVNYIKNGSNNQKMLSSDMLNSNRFGVRGFEDLGGGLRAGFWLESGLAPDIGTAGGGNGQAGVTAFWNRRSTLSLLGGFGEVRLGRDYVVTFSNRAAYDPFGFNGIGHMGLVESQLGSGAITQVRANNVVGYFLPSMGGLFGGAQVAAGEGNNGWKYMGGRLGYAAGPLSISGSFGKTYKTGTLSTDYKQMNFGASFNVGFMTIQGLYDKVDYGVRDQKHFLIGALVPLGSGTLKASFNKVSGNATGLASGVDAKLFAVGYQYDLSKRTALYATVSRLNNGGNAATGSRFVVSPGPLLTAGGQSSSGANLGVRHSF